jgi:hypothetical protein
MVFKTFDKTTLGNKLIQDLPIPRYSVSIRSRLICYWLPDILPEGRYFFWWNMVQPLED